jgi:hypothetical protein
MRLREKFKIDNTVSVKLIACGMGKNIHYEVPVDEQLIPLGGTL